MIDPTELEAAARTATPGPWFQSGPPWFSTGSLVLAGSPDPHVGLAVAWRVKDFADGWILFHSKADADLEAEGAGNLVEPLFPLSERLALLARVGELEGERTVAATYQREETAARLSAEAALRTSQEALAGMKGALEQTTRALKDVRADLSKEPGMQARRFVQLGICVSNAIDRGDQALSLPVGGGEQGASVAESARTVPFPS